MVLTVLGGIIAGAAAALVAYNHAHKNAPDDTRHKVVQITQTVGVVSAICQCFVAVLNALQLIGSIKGSVNLNHGNNNTRTSGLGSLREEWG